MMDENTTNGLVCTWVSVTDDAGRTHMEARWSLRQAAAAHAA
ncbi:hypothetical protein [Nocardioides currus]|nr:hypothetical protein [Nocardioides currus]